MGRNVSDRSESPVRGRGSPRRKSPSRRERSPMRHRSSRKDGSPAKEKLSSRARSPKHEKLSSPVARSPSPRTKRLRRAQVEREAERATDRGREKNHGKEYDRGSHREKGADRENGSGGKEKRSGREEIDYKSSRSRHGHSPSPSDRHHRSRHKSRSPQRAAETRERDEDRNSRGAEYRDDDDDSLAKMKAAEEALAAKQKQQPSFELSGKLAAETNRVRGITLLFTEPPEARKPDTRWRLYVFKGGEVLNEPLYIHRQSCYLFGRERRVADIPTDHPSCSKQHAVIQFRQVEKEQPDGTLTKQARPYIMDLGSTNKTFINGSPVEPQRYYELFEKDTIKFGNSSREYVLLHENSAT
ncbi:FHA domain-containing protein DDL isoform X1 [Tripterygium wilfordii]|uniref:FHA domain-containing protein DDL isoform X1 n=1 Tax=Tripterygium wilfordii TaxID=458696 RepID=A0A7J7C1D2_TRIWF|nr:FHA domain-containing protein DDL isoform X2 [Tripterygium wilfordii]KAF5727969.1 FHA domain-containing protein DDL isoform X1 [Tripterygium wilfordii]